MSKRDPGPDFVRTVAAFSVSLFHFIWLVGEFHYFEFLSILSVELFFILSGYLLTYQISLVNNNRNLLITFYYRRWIRTIPLYLIGLGSFAILTNKNLGDFITSLFFLDVFVVQREEALLYPISWSLCVEELFYLLFPLFCVTFLKSKSLAFKALFFILILNIQKIGLIFIFEPQEILFRISAICRIDAIALGVLLHQFTHSKAFTSTKQIISLLSIACVYLAFSSYLYLTRAQYFDYFFIFCVPAGTLFLYLTLSSTGSWLCQNQHISRINQFFANLSYPMYLFHLHLIALSRPLAESFGITAVLVAYFIILLPVSYYIHKYIEHPLNEMRPAYPTSHEK